jgi:hypothetical protein
MKIIRNERGVALVTALLITMISLVIVIGVLYMVIQNTRMTGTQKVYRNAVEASYGGTDVVLKEVLPRFFIGESTADILAAFPEDMNMEFTSNIDGTCFRDKLNKIPGQWNLNCPAESTNMDPRIAPDVRFEVRGTSNQRFVVFSKIVDTSPGTPYINPEGTELLGLGVTASSGSGASKGKHYVYRVEVAGQLLDNAGERGHLSVLYEY